MIRLGPLEETYWLDLLPGVRVRFRRITPAMMLVARQEVRRVLADGAEEDATVAGGEALTRTLARRGVVEWEGVGDADGNPIEATPEAVDLLMEHWPAYDAVDRLYVGPAFVMSAEKNGSSNSPDGTSAEAPTTALPAA
ncbi:hypothetical protein MMB17_18550 [Methylobacterium organophilum]|uniref:hypothetical protein n=1 Tax=Methylobacterium organophilum TaxID=410 RepID=UPI001F13124D|nr:hypothetical protein [Methylobacterium organophilum]UMY16663.1 hypothetical protein MMB17_18550 [Methylobacterium organophilum]